MTLRVLKDIPMTQKFVISLASNLLSIFRRISYTLLRKSRIISRDNSCAYVTADGELTTKRFRGIISSATWQMETALYLAARAAW